MGLFSRKMTENRRQEKDDNMTPEKNKKSNANLMIRSSGAKASLHKGIFQAFMKFCF